MSPKGPRTHNGIWALKPYYLGPWTLRGVIGVAYSGGGLKVSSVRFRILGVGLLRA